MPEKELSKKIDIEMPITEQIYLILYDPFLKLEYSPTAEHQKIVDALKNRTSKGAGKAVEKHIKSSIGGLGATEILPEDYLSI